MLLIEYTCLLLQLLYRICTFLFLIIQCIVLATYTLLNYGLPMYLIITVHFVQVKASTASATEQFDCEQYSSWSALGAIIRVINDSGTIDEDLQLRKIPTSTKWEEYVKINTAAEPNDLVNDILELLVQ